MKKAFKIVMRIAFLGACSNNNGQSGVQNDSMKVGDTNGDTARITDQSATGTSKGEHREDLSKRDTFDKKPSHWSGEAVGCWIVAFSFLRLFASILFNTHIVTTSQIIPTQKPATTSVA